MNQGWWSNIFQLSRLISRVNQTPFQAIFWIILILFFPTNSYRSSNKNEIQRDIFEMYRACESCRIFVSYLFNAHNGISYCMEKDRRKIAGKWRGFFFFFLSFVEKKSSPIVREDRSMKIQAYSWRFTLSGIRFCYSVGRKVGAAEEAGSKVNKCESFRAKVGEKIRAEDCNEDIGNFTVLLLLFLSVVFLESQIFVKFNPFSLHRFEKF